ncbi:MAG TPA: porin [Burkholderiales bacterium]|nr:porin [Burkholderiales bacterium]
MAGLFTAPAAMAEVTISGAINIGIAIIDSDDSVGGTPGDGINRMSLATNYTNMNVTSVDDIGNGNKIIANIQFDLGAMNNTNSFNNRNSYLGIEGGWGSFKMGTNENVYERWNYESDPLDGAMGIGGNIQMLGNTGLQGGGWFDVGNGQTPDNASFWRRTHHTIWYTSPNFGGFTFEVDRTLNAFKSTTADPVITSLGAQFKPEGGKFFVNVGYETHEEALSNLFGLHDATGMSAGGGIALGPFLITARVEQLEWELAGGAGSFERQHIWAGLKWTLPGGYFGAEVGMAGELDSPIGEIPDSEAMMIGLGYFHNLSKQSQLYVVGTQISNDDNSNYGIGAGTGSTGGFGSDHMAITVGMKHTF